MTTREGMQEPPARLQQMPARSTPQYCSPRQEHDSRREEADLVPAGNKRPGEPISPSAGGVFCMPVNGSRLRHPLRTVSTVAAPSALTACISPIICFGLMAETRGPMNSEYLFCARRYAIRRPAYWLARHLLTFCSPAAPPGIRAAAPR